MRKLSILIFSLIVMIFQLSCSTSSSSGYKGYESARQKTERLVQRYGALESPEILEYTRSLAQRLQHAMPKGTSVNSSYDLVIIHSSTPAAFSPGAGFILITRGLIDSLRTESELAFVIAHEIAHQELDHVGNEERIEKDNDGLYEKVEIDADRFAARVLRAAGLNPYEGLSAIRNGSFARDDIRKSIQNIGLIDKRMKALYNYMSVAGWRNSATTPSYLGNRSFENFKNFLRYYSSNDRNIIGKKKNERL